MTMEDRPEAPNDAGADVSTPAPRNARLLSGRLLSGRRRWLVPGAALSLVLLCGVGGLLWMRANAAPQVPAVDADAPPTDTVRIANIVHSPKEAWTYDYAVSVGEGRLDDPSITAIGPDTALVIPQLQSEQSGEVDYTPIATLVDLNTGEALWSADLSAAVEAGGERIQFEVDDVPGASFITVGTYEWNSSNGESFALDKSTGEVIDVLDRGARIYADGGGVIVEWHDEEQGVVVIRRFDSANIAGTPTWEVVTAGFETVVEQGVVFVHGSREASTSGDETLDRIPFSTDLAAFDAKTGKELEWSSQLDARTSFAYVGEQLIRIRATDDSFATLEVMGVDENGAETWDEPVEARQVDYADGALYVASTHVDWSTYGDLMRINPEDGKEMWDEPFAETISLQGDGFRHGVATVNDQLVAKAMDGGEYWTFDAATGKETAHYADEATVWLGETVFYARSIGRLAAYVPGNSKPVWKIKIERGDLVTPVGAHLIIVDKDDRTITGLA